MTLRILSALLVLLVLPASAQAPDAISGRWGNDDGTFLDLKYDGTARVSGTVTWRAGGQEITTPIANGTFDPKTRAFTIQGESEGPDGRKGPFRIEGTVTGDVVRGKYTFAGQSGDFSTGSRRDWVRMERFQ